MSDDWRVKVSVADHQQALALSDALRQGEVAHELADAPAGRVVVSVDERELFVYANTREQAQAALTAVAAEAARRNIGAQSELHRWHPAAERWEDPDVPLPEDPAGEHAEHAELIAAERAESERYGFPEWEVRVTCQSHSDTVALADQLREQGLPSVRRWRYLLVGAADEDAAAELARRIGALAPAGSSVTIEQTIGAALEQAPPNPFAVFGGLGA